MVYYLNRLEYQGKVYVENSVENVDNYLKNYYHK